MLQDMEHEAGLEEEEKPVEARKDVPDLRELIKKRQEERLFSAVKAGIMPSFLLSDSGGGEEAVAPPPDADVGDTEPARPAEEPMEVADGEASSSSSSENSDEDSD